MAKKTRDLSAAKLALSLISECDMQFYLKKLRRLVGSGRVTLQELGLTEEEYNGLPHLIDVIVAKRVLALVRRYGLRFDLDNLRKFFDSRKVTLEEIGLTEEEYRRLVHWVDVVETKSALLSLIRGSADRSCLRDVQRSVTTGKVTLEELELTVQEYRSLPRLVYVNEAKITLRLFAKYRFRYDLDRLQALLDTGKVTLVELGLTPEEYDELIASVR
jgi:hypothetical protein